LGSVDHDVNRSPFAKGDVKRSPLAKGDVNRSPSVDGDVKRRPCIGGTPASQGLTTQVLPVALAGEDARWVIARREVARIARQPIVTADASA
jgi:hypothetical protein